jgi:hypothetical protein
LVPDLGSYCARPHCPPAPASSSRSLISGWLDEARVVPQERAGEAVDRPEPFIFPQAIVRGRHGNPFVVLGMHGGAESAFFASPVGGAWTQILDSDAEHYGGAGVNAAPSQAEAIGWQNRPHSISLTLPPLATVFLTPAPGRS